MHESKFVFPQVMAMLPWRRFQTCVERYHGDKKITTLTTQEFFKIMAFAHILIKETTKLYRNDPIKLDINEAVYALDSTTIDLCKSLFPWTHFRRTKSAIKMHTMINLKGKIPISMGKMHDGNAMDHIDWEPGSWYVMDRGYLDL